LLFQLCDLILMIKNYDALDLVCDD
jgi:hypothetical protein